MCLCQGNCWGKSISHTQLDESPQVLYNSSHIKISLLFNDILKSVQMKYKEAINASSHSKVCWRLLLSSSQVHLDIPLLLLLMAGFAWFGFVSRFPLSLLRILKKKD